MINTIESYRDEFGNNIHLKEDVWSDGTKVYSVSLVGIHNNKSNIDCVDKDTAKGLFVLLTNNDKYQLS